MQPRGRARRGTALEHADTGLLSAARLGDLLRRRDDGAQKVRDCVHATASACDARTIDLERRACGA